ncbi:DUF397 domain-containing protein [Micromonospora sp. NPDC048842]|uniref:DUF397 domain-containing protein n=1 Tax=Micromonospora sp. NPDC048842 TaxID=3154346 RepID=UPI0033CCBC03
MDLSNARWRKSTRSGASGGNCVEVASNLPGVVAVRDSKDVTRAALTFAPVTWAACVTQIAEQP